MLDIVRGIRIVLVFSCKFICQIRNHVEDLGDGILILYIDQFGSVFIDDQHSCRRNLSAPTAGSVVFIALFKCSGSHTKRYIYQR